MHIDTPQRDPGQRSSKMAFKVPVLLSAFMLIFTVAPLVFTLDPQSSPISLVVNNPETTPVNVTYKTEVGTRWILLGAMRKLQKEQDFTFNFTENPNYGPFLVSVNGKAGSPADHTYWQLLVTLQNGTTIIPDVGVGCYIPNPNDTVILKFTKWSSSSEHTDDTNGLRAHDWRNERVDL